MSMDIPFDYFTTFVALTEPCLAAAVLAHSHLESPPLVSCRYNPTTPKFKMDQLYVMLMVILHRKDYGDYRLIIQRELNSGMGVVSIWAANALKLFVMVVLQSFTAAALLFALNTPIMGFGTFYSAYFLGTWAWSAFAQVVSLAVPNQVMAMLLLIVWPGFAAIYAVSSLTRPEPRTSLDPKSEHHHSTRTRTAP